MPLDDQTTQFLTAVLARFARPDATVPVLPDGYSADDARRILARVLADPVLLEEYRAAVYSGFTALPADVQDKWYETELPEFTEDFILSQGPAGLTEADLARLVLSETLLEEWELALYHGPSQPGRWFFDERLRNKG